MRLKRLIFSILCVAPFATSQALPADSISLDSLSAKERRYQERIARYEQRLAKRDAVWNSMIPNLYTLQYAGGIGTLSFGIGWDYGKNNQWETHFMAGFVRKMYDLPSYATITLRETFIPWRMQLSPMWSIRPLSVSLSVNSILNGDFWVSEPDRYPSGYYGFSSKVRFHLGLGQRVCFTIPKQKRFAAREISLYYEISTCDLYVRQKFMGTDIPLKDIIIIGIGTIVVI